jgi:aldehyde:ferredoxin oxidoreductase
MNGWVGKILRVNLSQSRCSTEELNSEIAARYIGGRGLAGKLFAAEVKPGTAALSAENKLVVMTGPLTGTGVLCSSGTALVTMSPLHGSMAISHLTGSFGLELKQAGFDGIIIEGQSSEPVVLVVNNGEAALKPAPELWGKTTWETEQALKQQVGNAWKADECSFISIGPAGEQCALVASLVHNRFREAGQGGMGAVMGAKKLKAIMVWGGQAIGVADAKSLRRTTQEALEKYKTLPVIPTMLRNLGTASMVKVASDLGVLPTKNFATGVFADAEKLFAETLARSIWLKPKACPTCPIACTRVAAVPGTKREIIEGPEYEALVFFGSACGVSNIEHILEAVCLALKLGLDTFAAGSALATAMELKDKGFAADKDLDQKLAFGNGKSMVKVLQQIAQKKATGALLADGGAQLAARFGHSECFMGVRSMEAFIADPRGINALGLYGATSNNGAEYFSSMSLAMVAYNLTQGLDLSKPASRSAFVKRLQDTAAFSESLGLCPLILLGIGVDDIDAMAAATLGTGFGPDKLMQAGERIWNAERSYHLKSGWQAGDDRLPGRFVDEPMPEGPAKGQVCRLDEDLSSYYSLRKWDAKGVPTQNLLAELEL